MVGRLALEPAHGIRVPTLHRPVWSWTSQLTDWRSLSSAKITREIQRLK